MLTASLVLSFLLLLLAEAADHQTVNHRAAPTTLPPTIGMYVLQFYRYGSR